MRNRLKSVRLPFRLSYANVVATLALFVALGGTGYAAYSLPRNSVGARELRAHSVGHSELRAKAVTSANVRDGSLGTKDLSPAARAALGGRTGPAGPRGPEGAKGEAGAAGPAGAPGAPAITYWEVVNDSNHPVAGTARDVTTSPTTGQPIVEFDRSVAKCAAVATLAHLADGFSADPPPRATVDVEITRDGNVLVHTYDPSGMPLRYPFHLIVAC